MRTPVMVESRCAVRAISSVLIRVESPPYASRRVRSPITISSIAALPARSPIPQMVHSTCLAPARTPASEFATARPRSSWQWVETVTFSIPLTRFMTAETMAANSSGVE